MTTSNPTAEILLYHSATIRQLEQQAIKQAEDGNSLQLMQHAAEALLALIKQQWPQFRRILVYTGQGNNAGDGYLLAALAHQQHYDIRICATTRPEQLKGTARLAAEIALAAGVPLTEHFDEAELLIDALFGIGLNRPLPEEMQQLIQQINHSGKPVLAVDIPSGLAADTGECMPVAVKATITLSFIGYKPGQYLLNGTRHCGVLHQASLLSQEQLQNPAADFQLVTATTIKKQLPPRPASAHKGQFGHVLVIGGDSGMGGAAIMAAEAALYCGAGKVSLYTQPEHIAPALTRRPELMAACSRSHELIQRATVIVAGPGLGQGNWGRALLAQLMLCNKPMVLDADALNYLASLSLAERKQLKRDNWILTPHPGEAARLLSRSPSAIQQNRPAALQMLQQQFGGTVLLKGQGTLISNGTQPVSILNCGNPGMATGGMGDVLSGIIGALLAQGLSPYEAARCGGWLHSTAADQRVQQQGERGLLATELLPQIRSLL